jgi:predicted O-methyltransferase YrrM
MKHIDDRIEGWFDFDVLYGNIVYHACDNSHFVEVGAWKGKSTSFLAVEIINSGKKIKLDVVDTWEGSSEHRLENNDELYLEFLKNIEPVRHVVNPIRKKSTEAAKLYEDNSLDFVFIDAAHDYENVKADITSWYPKIKIGGVIAGHDYYESWPEVKMAVNEFFKDSIFYPFSKSWVHRKC